MAGRLVKEEGERERERDHKDNKEEGGRRRKEEEMWALRDQSHEFVHSHQLDIRDDTRLCANIPNNTDTCREGRGESERDEGWWID